MLFYILKEKGNLKKAYRMHKASKKIKQLNLFDEDFYLKKNPDVENARAGPLNHYLYHGYKERRQPGKLFDNNFYLSEYPDVREAGENPLVHYVLHGKKEGRLPYKSQNNLEKYVNILNNLEEQVKRLNDLENQVKRLNTIVHKQNEYLNSYNNLFNDLYIFHETYPKGVLKDMQDLCLELLVFIDNICEKYDIKYWLDYGNLLGPVRHGGFLPWDDDMDLGMLTNDLNRFLEALDKEVKVWNLEGYVNVIEKKKYNNTVTGFVQILSNSPVTTHMMAGIDILQYEYLKNEDNLPKEDLKNKISDQIGVTKQEFLDNRYFEKSPEEAQRKLNEIVGIVDHEDEYIIPAAVNLRQNRIRIYKSEEMFPLQKIKFGDYAFLAAKDEKAYLTMSYGENFMKMPKRISFHNRMHSLIRLDIDDLHGVFLKEIERLREVNENFN